MTDKPPDDFVLTDMDGRILADGNAGLLKDHPNIFSFLASDLDREALKRGMSLAEISTPIHIDLSFTHKHRSITYICQVFKSEQSYLIVGWRLPKNVHRFPVSQAV